MKKILTYTIGTLAFLIICGSMLTSAQAQNTIPSGGTGGNTIPSRQGNTIPSNTSSSNSTTFIQNPLKAKDINELIVILVDVAVKLGMIVAFLGLIWVGFKFVIAQGDPTKIGQARTHFFYLIIGIAILIGAKVIIEIIKGTLEPFVDTSLLNSSGLKK